MYNTYKTKYVLLCYALYVPKHQIIQNIIVFKFEKTQHIQGVIKVYTIVYKMNKKNKIR